MIHEERDDLEPNSPNAIPPANAGRPFAPDEQQKRMKKVTFDDFQITREGQAAQVEEERRAWRERQERLEREKPSILRMAVPRIKSLRDEMIGVQNKLGLFRKSHPEADTAQGPQEPPVNMRPASGNSAVPYFAEHERAVVRVSRLPHEAHDAHNDWEAEGRNREPIPMSSGSNANIPSSFPEHYEEQAEIPEQQDESHVETWEAEEEAIQNNSEDRRTADEMDVINEEEDRDEEEVLNDFHLEDDVEEDEFVERYTHEMASDSIPFDTVLREEETPFREPEREPVSLEPNLEPSLSSFLDALRAFDSRPRRATETRDPRADFVVLLGDLLDILRDELDATSAMFFWVNAKKQQLVLESAALDDRAYQFLAADKRFPIELDAVSRIVSKRRPELHSTIAPQAELDLIPYYRDAIGIASFAGMPVLFGDGLVAVLTVDSATPDHFSAETLRILTDYSKVISGLIRSYIEKYDLLAASRALDAARKLHELVSPDSALRVIRDQRKNPEYILRALTEAASQIIEWDWLAAASFDEGRRLWNISSLQSKRTGAYAPPQSLISLEESIVGKCLETGKSVHVESLSAQHIRYNLEEDRHSAVGHSFLAIPIRTAVKNYGVLAIEHSERARYTSADVETLEHLARSAASALEIVALGEMVGARALTDLLTGVLNKRGLLERATQELARAMQFDEPLTFVLFEMDGASEFSSRFSQEDSDTMVLAITRLLKFGARPFDVIARTGEHTFAALLIKMSDEESYLWSEKMRKMIVSEVIAIGKRSYSVTVSIGVSGARRDGTVEELIEGAELALERARELGGNNVIVY